MNRERRSLRVDLFYGIPVVASERRIDVEVLVCWLRSRRAGGVCAILG